MRRLLTIALAVGLALLLDSAAGAASLNTNLVVDPGFENVNTGITGPYGSVKLLDWPDYNGDGDDNYAYRYSTGYSGANVPAGAGTYFYWGGYHSGSKGAITVYQDIDVSTGGAATAIANGTATYSFSAWFSGYDYQEFNAMQAVLLDGGGGTLAMTPKIGGDAFCRAQPHSDGRDPDWAWDSVAGAIPVGTETVRLEIVTDTDNFIPYFDGYVDLVDFQVTPEPASLWLLGMAGLAAIRRRRA